MRTLVEPVPAQAGRPADPMTGSPLARLVLGRARMRGPLPVDVITFRALCPACGSDCEWIQQREDTRLRSDPSCPCAAA
ncbi:MAG TPA: hypothetical protein VHN80_01900 [Kineosporiaceae bacterium]|nr:hypothetical protein [Kineosporiaceae bacterium]